jgi:hypothetical protein
MIISISLRAACALSLSDFLGEDHLFGISQILLDPHSLESKHHPLLFPRNQPIPSKDTDSTLSLSPSLFSPHEFQQCTKAQKWETWKAAGIISSIRSILDILTKQHQAYPISMHKYEQGEGIVSISFEIQPFRPLRVSPFAPLSAAQEV